MLDDIERVWFWSSGCDDMLDEGWSKRVCVCLLTMKEDRWPNLGYFGGGR